MSLHVISCMVNSLQQLTRTRPQGARQNLCGHAFLTGPVLCDMLVTQAKYMEMRFTGCFFAQLKKKKHTHT